MTDAGEFKLGLINALAPEHVNALRPLLGEGFKGGKVRLTPEGLLLEGKGNSATASLKREGKPLKLTSGSLHFDGKSLLVVLDAKKSLDKRWQCVGQAILTQGLIDAASGKTPPVITSIEGLSI